MLFMEANLDKNDYSGPVGPTATTLRALSTRLNGRGNLMMADCHVESLTATNATKLERSQLFWFPTSDLRGLNDMDLKVNLSDP